MKQKLEVTPLVFFDLFVLCFYWQWNGIMSWTTVDHVVRILHGLGILNDKQKKVLFKNVGLQSLVRNRSEAFGIVGYNNIQNSTCKLVFVIKDRVTMNRERMLRDYRFYLPPAGAQYARSIEEKYATFITKEVYLNEIERQNKNEKQLAAIMPKYNAKVLEEVGE